MVMDEGQPRKATIDRRQALTTYLSELGESASIEELADLYQVSPSTIRRDLRSMADTGDLVRTYGGAAPTARSEFGWNRKSMEFASQKAAIANFARDNLIEPTDVLFLDSGTTSAEVARKIASWPELTVIVGGLSALIALADGEPEVHVLGGRLRRPSASFLGINAIMESEAIQPDIAILGCESVDPQRGINCADFEQSKFKALMMENAKQTWIVVDESKLRGEARFAFWAPLSSTTGFIVPHTRDTKVRETVAELRSKGHVVHEV